MMCFSKEWRGATRVKAWELEREWCPARVSCLSDEEMSLHKAGHARPGSIEMLAKIWSSFQQIMRILKQGSGTCASNIISIFYKFQNRGSE